MTALYRQAVFNALLGNTDDHLKHFALRHVGTEGSGWRLTPAYDLPPDEPPRGEHLLRFGSVSFQPDAQGLAGLGRAFGLSPRASARTRPVRCAAGDGGFDALNIGPGYLSPGLPVSGLGWAI